MKPRLTTIANDFLKKIIVRIEARPSCNLKNNNNKEKSPDKGARHR